MQDINGINYLRDAAKEFSIYTCTNRGIPNIFDGLKDVQRKCLWNLRNKRDKIKVISVAGELLSSGLYVHGDSSAQDAIGKMAAPYLNNIPLLDGIGNFGSRTTPSAIAAGRYIYVKKSSFADNVILNDLDIIPLIDNYDGSTKEPVHFIPLIPVVLLNGISGIAVGWSTEILPHKFEDLVSACEQVIDNKKIKLLIPFYNKFNLTIKRIEGNKWEFSGMVDIINNSSIRVLELPPELSIEKFRDRLNEYEDQGKIKNYTDKSTDHIDILINFKKDELNGWDKDKIIDFLNLRIKKTERIVVLNENNTSIRQYPDPESVVKDFVNWRLGWYKVRYENLLKIAEKDLNFHQALEECFKKKLSQSILTLANKQEVKDLVKTIVSKFNLEDDQIEKIVSMPSYKWAKDCLTNTQDKITELLIYIDLYKKILADETEIKKIYKQELNDLKRLKL